jgi:hypothetical protein
MGEWENGRMGEWENGEEVVGEMSLLVFREEEEIVACLRPSLVALMRAGDREDSFASRVSMASTLIERRYRRFLMRVIR